jgi:uncharacterized protein (DUF1684 family)
MCFASVFVFFLALSSSAFPATTTDAAYRAEVEKWRQAREARLKADDGYLSIVGLFWLKEGENHFGSSPLNDFVLPEGSCPPRAGDFVFENGKINVHIDEDVKAELDGKPVREAAMVPDSDDKGPSVLKLDSLTLFVHASGARLAIRVKDKNSPLLKEFAGLRWFPVDESYRVTGKFVSYDKPKEVDIANILGDVDKMSSPGEVVFTLHGQEMRMQAVTDDKKLWFIFRDLTSGKETYGAARFLYADPPKDGKVILDFNEAYNPPCAFNPFTTCPLPPPENRLPVRVEAGEMKYVHGH